MPIKQDVTFHGVSATVTIALPLESVAMLVENYHNPEVNTYIISCENGALFHFHHANIQWLEINDVEEVVLEVHTPRSRPAKSRKRAS